MRTRHKRAYYGQPRAQLSMCAIPEITERREWRSGRFGPVIIPISPVEVLILDYITDRYRVAWYKHALWDGDELETKRFAYESETLKYALEVVMGESATMHIPEQIETYIRATLWGERLP